MKRSIKLFWHGLTGILAYIAEWFTVVLGMKDESKYGKFIRRVVGTSFATLMLIITICALYGLCDGVKEKFNLDWWDDGYIAHYDNVFVSRNITYHSDYYSSNGYLFDANEKKVLKGVSWIAKPLGEDSLVCYSDGKKRGYFNMFTGKTVIKPQYAHAWVFSDGLASVDDNGWIKFIDQTGKVIIDNHMPYMKGKDGYVFHNGSCAVHNDRGDRLGLIDKQGKWVLQPEYLSIVPADTFWIVSNGKERSVLTASLTTVIPFTKATFWFDGNGIEATMADHTIRKYSYDGEIIENFHISRVEQLLYDTDVFRYVTVKDYDENGNIVGEHEESETIQAVARCRCYESEHNWYGLISADGHVITPPSYSSITAIGADLYLCKLNDYEQGIILNGTGQKIE